jgi:G3E family GTPase
VDAPSVKRAVAESDEAKLQIERADILVLNKLDLVDDDGGAAEQHHHHDRPGAHRRGALRVVPLHRRPQPVPELRTRRAR